MSTDKRDGDGEIFRPKYTRPLPDGAALIDRDGERWALWTDRRGRKHEGKLTASGSRVLVESGSLYIRYRHADGLTRPERTDCRTIAGARDLLTDRRREVERVLSGAISAAEAETATHKKSAAAVHVAEYVEHLRNSRGKGGRARINAVHVANVERHLRRLFADCGVERLRDFDRKRIEKWARDREAEAVQAGDGKPTGISPRTVNMHLAAASGFGNWCVDTGRLSVNPLARPPKRDESTDRRRTRRALSGPELVRLLDATQRRDVAEFGRQSARVPGSDARENRRSRRTWNIPAVTPATLAECERRGRQALAKRPEFVATLERRGRARATLYKFLALTGARWGEARSLRIGSLVLDSEPAYAVLAAGDAKSGKRAELPLRADVAGDIRAMLAERLQVLRETARADGKPLPAKLPDGPLFDMPAAGVRAFDRDCRAAGLPKHDDRGRVLDVHALRHSFATALSAAGVAPRVAQAACRHSTIELTMQTYTDPRLLDVAGALEKLPELPLGATPNAGRALATGTHGRETLVDFLSDSCRNGGENVQESAGSGGKPSLVSGRETLASPGSGGTWQQAAGSGEHSPQGDSNPCSRLEKPRGTLENVVNHGENERDAGRLSDACRNAAGGTGSDSLAEALAMLARLPLTDAERAEAVRRLLAEAGRQ